ncbi:hypothetical protein ACFV1V_10080 [Streptomyces globisporus]|uniref:hypothetical protein n=1 Tax=Streptomyces globisporus TaxID=1908 RepID=UPI003690E09E
MVLLVQYGTFIGWSLTEPASYVTTGFAAPGLAPPPRPPGSCSSRMDLVATPWLEAVRCRNPAAASRLRELDHRLRDQREVRNRADTLLALIGELVEDYGSR